MLCYMATVDEYDGVCMEYRNGSGHEFATQWHVCLFELNGWDLQNNSLFVRSSLG